jgi:hypothetical protein
MITSVPTVEALLARVTALPIILGTPKYEGIALPRQIAMGVESYDWRADHGHVGLVMMEVECMMQISGQ